MTDTPARSTALILHRRLCRKISDAEETGAGLTDNKAKQVAGEFRRSLEEGLSEEQDRMKIALISAVIAAIVAVVAFVGMSAEQISEDGEEKLNCVAHGMVLAQERKELEEKTDVRD